MIRSLVAVAVLIASSTIALAKPSSPGLTRLERCTAWMNDLHIDSNFGHPMPVTPLGDGACRYGTVELQAGPHAGYEVSVLEVRGIDFDPTREDGPPMSLRIDAHDVLETHPGISGVQDWMLRQVRTPFDVVVDLVFDPVAKTGTLRELSMTGVAIGRVELDGIIEGTDELDDQQSTRFGLRALHARVDSRNFLTGYVLPPLVGFLEESDPAAFVANQRRDAAAFVTEGLPHSGASPATIAALLGVITDLPRLDHPFELTLTTPAGPITPADLERAADSRFGAAALMFKLRVEASYGGPFTNYEGSAP